ncbi:hypothetical protein [Citrobacter portucalensis]|uniref:hypothetical protein n=1 Tax=Citrobacter portucalensis TaxID=1639133 RepID=UPI0025436B38|nr:hypothetical protein [Citrobacter portucalensis]WIJ56775.1 hypothetical protein OI981_12865 [Citrobacter portucalensis]
MSNIDKRALRKAAMHAKTEDDCVAWKPELSKLLCDGQLLDVVIDAYQSARQRVAELEEKLANPVLLPKTNGYWNEQEKAYEEAITPPDGRFAWQDSGVRGMNRWLA